MLRIRLFRILLPVLLVGIVVLLVWAIQPPPTPAPPLGADEDPIRESDDLTFRRWTLGEDGSLAKELELVTTGTEECGPDCTRFFDVQRFELTREAQGPLEISAEQTDVAGPVGHRRMRFEGPVRVVDEELGLVLDLPHLDVDESSGLGRSEGAIYIEGAGHHTRAERLLYGLAGQATQLFQLEVEDDEGALLMGQKAFLHDGLEDIELIQGVRYRRGNDDERFWSDEARVLRDESGRMKRLTGKGNVLVGLRGPDGVVEVAGNRLEAVWSDAGDLQTVTIEERGLIEQGPQFVAAERLVITALPDDGGWDVEAEGTVRVSGTLDAGTGRIRSDKLTARFDGSNLLSSSEATGEVRFEAPDLRADAAVARAQRDLFRPDILHIELLSSDERRARLSQGQTRMAADTIRTDAGGETLKASGRVESTLLPAADGVSLQGMFSTDKAVHFISADLETGAGGTRLLFTGNVRGWQGEQNLSAKTVRVDQEQGTLSASGGVSTRFPRVREEVEAAAGADDFIQVTAATLDYEQGASVAIYREGVRLVFAEGWIESDVLTVRQNAAGELEELLAEGSVKLEFLGTEEGDGEPVPRTTGNSDRLRYLPAEETVWLYGDAQRARIQRGGEQAATSEGRVLTYRLSDGTLSVVEGGSVKARSPQEQEKAPE